MRLIIDTNLFISALINQNSRKRLDLILENDSFEILANNTSIKELDEVANRNKFKKYVSPNQVEIFLELIFERITFIHTKSDFKVSPDPKDNFLLNLAYDGNADYLITGNKIDLLELKSFHKTKIITLSEFLQG